MRSRLTYRAGEFCTTKCFLLSRKIFTALLKDGRFEMMLAQVIEEEMKKADGQSSQAVHPTSRTYATWQRGMT